PPSRRTPLPVDFVTSLVCLPSIPFTLLISFSSSVAPRAPHSFPTRRSSDLLRQCDHRLVASDFRHDARRRDRGHGAVPRSRRRRSEEHTSELQSRFDLVCRLLLEKKKRTLKSSTSSTLRPTEEIRTTQIDKV